MSNLKRIISITFFIVATVNVNAQQKIMGFAPAGAVIQSNWEKQYDSLIDPHDMDTWMQFLASHPHNVGTAKDKANAEYIADLFKQWGYQTEIKSYYVLYPTPKFRSLELLGDTVFKAKLQEPALAEDRTSGQQSEQLPTYNAYSADGDVTAELVFVNRGVPADYDELDRMGISVKGKIVIAKYGGSWRGIKPKVAYEHGAIGCIIYSDPADDGYAQGDVYPQGPFKPKDGVQRGSVMDMPTYPGDPLTPGIGATKDAKRLDIKDAKTVLKIPVLPISYGDALPLLQSLRGPVAPAAWRGALPITYHIGPGIQKVHLQLQFNWDIVQLYDVIAKMPGSEMPDEWVIRGNHHDAWVNGAADPISGLVTELAEAKAVGELAKKGFKPKRTLVYCAWDGEEPALLGSTEWVEDHQDELTQKAVAYINTDGYARGFLGASGSHVLEPFFNEIAANVIDPQTGSSVRYRKYAQEMVMADNTNRAKMIGNQYLKLNALGSGSDYSSFIDHLGITSVDLEFDGEGNGGEYHSIYDSYDMFIRFKDPGFKYGVALSKTSGRFVLRLADADILPVDYSSFYKTVADYDTELKAMVDNARSEINIQNEMIQDSLFTLAKDPTIEYHQPPIKPAVPFLNFSSLDNALVLLKAVSDSFQKKYTGAIALPLNVQQQLNEVLYKSERYLLNDKGLPRRPWYKNEIYAPGFYTGYGVKTLPGIREAIEQRNWIEAQDNIEIVAQTLLAYIEQIRKANELLK